MKIKKIRKNKKEIQGNRIVLKYDFENLVALAKINKDSGKDVPYDEFIYELWPTFNRVREYKEYTEMTLAQLKALNTKDIEGFVCQNLKTGQRLKVKMEDYVRLHSIITNITFRDIWKTLRAGEPLTEVYENVPDEFYDWVKEKVKFLEDVFDEKLKQSHMNFEQVMLHMPKEYTQSQFAKVVMELITKNARGRVFAIKNGYDISESIWKEIYPGHEKPFSV
jgi:RNA ligase